MREEGTRRLKAAQFRRAKDNGDPAPPMSLSGAEHRWWFVAGRDEITIILLVSARLDHSPANRKTFPHETKQNLADFRLRQ